MTFIVSNASKQRKIQTLWSTFFELMKTINEQDCDSDEIDVETKVWVTLFSSIYQSKYVTPYTHAFAIAYI